MDAATSAALTSWSNERMEPSGRLIFGIMASGILPQFV
jgi:hypothetical protein